MIKDIKNIQKDSNGYGLRNKEQFLLLKDIVELDYQKKIGRNEIYNNISVYIVAFVPFVLDVSR